jgi:hypothetical protein
MPFFIETMRYWHSETSAKQEKLQLIFGGSKKAVTFAAHSPRWWNW